jgi:hypothetical protein
VTDYEAYRQRQVEALIKYEPQKLEEKLEPEPITLAPVSAAETEQAIDAAGAGSGGPEPEGP